MDRHMDMTTVSPSFFIIGCVVDTMSMLGLTSFLLKSPVPLLTVTKSSACKKSFWNHTAYKKIKQVMGCRKNGVINTLYIHKI